MAESLQFLADHSDRLKARILTAPSLPTYDGESQINLSETAFFTWICSSYEEKVAMLAGGPASIYELQSSTIGLDLDDEDEDEEMLDEEESSGDEVVPAAPSNLTGRAHKFDYISPQHPAGSPAPTTFVEAALAIIFHFVASGRDGKNLKTLSSSQVKQAIYKDFNIPRPETNSRLFHHYAGAIHSSLPTAFRNAKIGIEIAALTAKPITGPIRCNSADYNRKANDSYQEFLRNDVFIRRGSGRTAVGSVAGGSGGVRGGTTGVALSSVAAAGGSRSGGSRSGGVRQGSTVPVSSGVLSGGVSSSTGSTTQQTPQTLPPRIIKSRMYDEWW